MCQLLICLGILAFASTVASQSCSTAADCSNHGTCDGSGCICDTTYAGTTCNACDEAAGYFSYPDCSVICLDNTCSGHGSCLSPHGTCRCDAGYVGTHCNRCESDYYGYPGCAYCTRNVNCSSQGSCQLSGSSVVCTCDDPGLISGASCNECADTTFHNFPKCDSACPVDCGEAEGRGSCSATTNGLCACTAGFAGASCEHCATDHYGFPACHICRPSLDCNGRGVCDNRALTEHLQPASTRSYCVCDYKYTASDCSTNRPHVEEALLEFALDTQTSSFADALWDDHFLRSTADYRPAPVEDLLNPLVYQHPTDTSHGGTVRRFLRFERGVEGNHTVRFTVVSLIPGLGVPAAAVVTNMTNNEGAIQRHIRAAVEIIVGADGKERRVVLYGVDNPGTTPLCGTSGCFGSGGSDSKTKSTVYAVVGVVVGLALVGGLVILVYKMRAERKRAIADNGGVDPYDDEELEGVNNRSVQRRDDRRNPLEGGEPSIVDAEADGAAPVEGIPIMLNRHADRGAQPSSPRGEEGPQGGTETDVYNYSSPHNGQPAGSGNQPQRDQLREEETNPVLEEARERRLSVSSV